jgi:hypothetical protein
VQPPFAPRTGTERAVVGLGLVALAGMVWALWLAFWPVPHHGERDASTVPGLSCGTPAFYSQTRFADSLMPRWGTDDDSDVVDQITAECTHRIDTRIRYTVGVGVVTFPVTALWLWCDLKLHPGRGAAALARRPVRATP